MGPPAAMRSWPHAGPSSPNRTLLGRLARSALRTPSGPEAPHHGPASPPYKARWVLGCHRCEQEEKAQQRSKVFIIKKWGTRSFMVMQYYLLEMFLIIGQQYLQRWNKISHDEGTMTDHSIHQKHYAKVVIRVFEMQYFFLGIIH